MSGVAALTLSALVITGWFAGLPWLDAPLQPLVRLNEFLWPEGIHTGGIRGLAAVFMLPLNLLLIAGLFYLPVYATCRLLDQGRARRGA